MSFATVERLRDEILADTELSNLIQERYAKPLKSYTGRLDLIDNVDDCPALIFRPVKDSYPLKLSKQLRSESVLSIFIVICESETDENGVYDGARYKAVIAEKIIEIINRQPFDNVDFEQPVIFNDLPEKHPIYRSELNITYFEVV